MKVRVFIKSIQTLPRISYTHELFLISIIYSNYLFEDLNQQFFTLLKYAVQFLFFK